MPIAEVKTSNPRNPVLFANIGRRANEWATPEYGCRSSGQTLPPPNMLLWFVDGFELLALEIQQMLGEAFWVPPSAQRLSLQRELNWHTSPGVSSAREDWLLSQEWRLEVNTTPRHSVTTTAVPICSSKCPVIFPKIIHNPPGGLIPLLLALLRCYLSLKSKPLQSDTHFPLDIFHGYMRHTY